MTKIPQDDPIYKETVWLYPANSNQPKGWTKAQWLLFGIGIGMWTLWIAQRLIDLAG
ncbi:MAG: hypothetical protein WC722_05890 [Rhodospirillales bacterium]